MMRYPEICGSSKVLLRVTVIAATLIIFCIAAVGAGHAEDGNSSQNATAPLLYVCNYDSRNISVIDTGTDEVVETIDGFSSPYGVAISPDGSKVFVAHYQWNNTEDGVVSVIDARSNSVVKQLSLGVNPRGFAFSPDSCLLYVICEDPAIMSIAPWGSSVLEVNERRTDSLYVIDVATCDVRQTGHVRYMPSGIAVSPDGSRLYVTCTNGSIPNAGDLQVIDTGSLATTRTTGAGMQPKGMAISPDGKEIYIIHWLTSSVTVIDTANGTTIASIPGHNEPGGIVFSPDGDRVYVSCGDWPVGHVSVIDAGSKKVVRSIEVGTRPAGMAICPRQGSVL